MFSIFGRALKRLDKAFLRRAKTFGLRHQHHVPSILPTQEERASCRETKGWRATLLSTENSMNAREAVRNSVEPDENCAPNGVA